jgi:hypothetical protein
MYEGDSVIICNVRIFLRFATLLVAHEAVYMCLSILTPWCRFDLYSVFLSWVSRCQQGRPAIQIYKGRAASSGLFCMDWRCTSAAMHRAMSMQCCVAKETERLKKGRTSVKHEDGAGQSTERNGECVAGPTAQNLFILRAWTSWATRDHEHQKKGDYVEIRCTCKISTLAVTNIKHTRTLQIIIDSLSSCTNVSDHRQYFIQLRRKTNGRNIKKRI